MRFLVNLESGGGFWRLVYLYMIFLLSMNKIKENLTEFIGKYF